MSSRPSSTASLSSYCQPEREARERRGPARHVEEAVVYRARARRLTALVLLVHERHGRDERERRGQPRTTERREPRSAHRARGQQREYRVLRDVRHLAHEEVDLLYRSFGDAWEEIDQERLNYSRRVRRREVRRRGEEHEGRPRHDGAVTPQAARAPSRARLKARVGSRDARARTRDRMRVPTRAAVCAPRLVLRAFVGRHPSDLRLMNEAENERGKPRVPLPSPWSARFRRTALFAARLTAPPRPRRSR